MGTNKKTNRIKNTNKPRPHKKNIKPIKDNEKEEAYREIWKNVIKIGKEENIHYDIDT